MIRTSEGGDILLTRRFDYDEAGHKLHSISGSSLLNLHRVQENNPACGYPGLPSLLREIASDPRVATRELFRRMTFRVLIGDTDDHDRNHGFLRQNGQYWHAPLFDVLPHINTTVCQAMPIGIDGRQRSLKNLLSMSASFGLEMDEAVEIVRSQLPVIRQWRNLFRSAGIGDRDIELLTPCFRLAENQQE